MVAPKDEKEEEITRGWDFFDVSVCGGKINTKKNNRKYQEKFVVCVCVVNICFWFGDVVVVIVEF